MKRLRCRQQEPEKSQITFSWNMHQDAEFTGVKKASDLENKLTLATAFSPSISKALNKTEKLQREFPLKPVELPR